MKYVSAKWVGDPENPAIEAIGEDGLKYYPGRLESTVPPWPEYLAEGGTIDPADPIVEPIPDEISDRQCFQQLAIMGLITQQEALTYLGNGTLPAAFEAFVEALPEASQFDARMKLMANNFRRSDSWVDVFGQMQGMTPEQVDDIWRAAALL